MFIEAQAIPILSVVKQTCLISLSGEADSRLTAFAFNSKKESEYACNLYNMY